MEHGALVGSRVCAPQDHPRSLVGFPGGGAGSPTVYEDGQQDVPRRDLFCRIRKSAWGRDFQPNALACELVVSFYRWKQVNDPGHLEVYIKPLFFFKKFYWNINKIWTLNFVLLSGIQQSKPVMQTPISIPLQILFPNDHRVLRKFPCALQKVSVIWLWCRPVARAPTGPLAWEPPYPVGAALKSKIKKKERIQC